MTMIHESLFESDDGSFRAEAGPAKVRGIATVELLKTLPPHYQNVTARKLSAESSDAESSDDESAGEERSALDADGNLFFLGDEFFYLDWGGEKVWYVYQLAGVGDRKSWCEVGVRKSLEEATAFIGELSNAATG